MVLGWQGEMSANTQEQTDKTTDGCLHIHIASPSQPQPARPHLTHWALALGASCRPGLICPGKERQGG